MLLSAEQDGDSGRAQGPPAVGPRGPSLSMYNSPPAGAWAVERAGSWVSTRGKKGLLSEAQTVVEVLDELTPKTQPAALAAGGLRGGKGWGRWGGVQPLTGSGLMIFTSRCPATGRMMVARNLPVASKRSAEQPRQAPSKEHSP